MNIKQRLELSHRLIMRAGFLIVSMLAKRTLHRSNVDAAILNLEEATRELRYLQENTNERTNSPRM